MNLPDITNNNVASFFDKETIVIQTAEQIMKDFGMFGVTITFSGNIEKAYNELHEQLTNQIAHLHSNNSQKLLSVLYQVDISKRQLEKSQQELPQYTYTELMAHEVIVRELKKVLMRQYFKSQS